MREFLDHKWGTRADRLRDTTWAWCACGLLAPTPSRSTTRPLVNKIVGAQRLYETKQITDFLRGHIVAKLTDLLAR